MLTDSSGVQIDTFLDLTRKYQVDIESKRDSVLYVYEIFSVDENVWPDQCHRAINHLRMIGEPVQDLCELIEQATFLQMAVDIPLSSLLMTLYNFNEQLKIIMMLLHTLQATCQTLPSQTVKQCQEVRSRLKVLLHSTKEILQQTIRLRDQARFSKAYLNIKQAGHGL